MSKSGKRKQGQGMLQQHMQRAKARNAAREGQWDLAIKHYRKLSAGRKATVRDKIQLAHAYKENGEIERALDTYLSAAQAYPFDIDAQRQAGHFLKRLGKTDDAAAYFTRALVSDPSLEDIAGELSALKADDVEAFDRTYLRGALAGRDLSVKSSNALSSILSVKQRSRARQAARKREWKDAERAYRMALRYTPDQPALLVQLAHCVREQMRPEEALAIYRQALLLTPRDSDIHLHVARTLREMGRLRAAWDAYDVAVELRPGSRILEEEIEAFQEQSGIDRALNGAPTQFSSRKARPQRIEQLAEEAWLTHRQKVTFKFLSGALAYKD